MWRQFSFLCWHVLNQTIFAPQMTWDFPWLLNEMIDIVCKIENAQEDEKIHSSANNTTLWIHIRKELELLKMFKQLQERLQ